MKKCFNETCNNEISINRKYCSSRCAAIVNNSLHPKRTNGREKPKCKNCNKSLNTFQKKYCDNKCQQSYLYRTLTLPKFYSGLISGTGTIRNILIELYKNKCSECGQDDNWNNKPLTLQVDHIDGNSDNNNPDNLRLLCPNCHTQTDTFSTRQKKNTKRNRYLRKYKK